jgi:uncharacterized protein (TIGR04222 family)
MMMVMAGQLTLTHLESSEPWGLSGPQFLGLYAALLVGCIVIAFWAAWSARRSPSDGYPYPPRDLDVYEAAYLSAGPIRVAQTAAFSLLAADRIRGSRSGSMTTVVQDGRGSAQDPVAGVVLELLARREPTRLKPVVSEAARHPLIAEVGQRLHHDGLVSGKRAVLIERSALLPIAALLCVGLARLVEGLGNDRPVGFLLLLLVATVGLGVVVVADPPPLRTARGDAKLSELNRDLHPGQGLALAAVPVMDVALLGGAAITDPVVRGWVFGNSSDDGDGGDGGGDGSGSCGSDGGGCGGCGG